ncbi:procathepsin L-like [Mercenaria mercenaria]|uniref:procathepsin L-like n=1 Tax=Mercenaria mercenaria TaxID=6596 RepID=UPI00234F922A|nr:procathepsin L-like [Mercenaria mercenaria]
MTTLFAAAVVCILAPYVIGLPFNSGLDLQWEQFKLNYSKLYDPVDEAARRIIWEENLRYIEKHNAEAKQGKHTFILGINEYADMTSNEFVAAMNGYRHENLKFGICHLYVNPADISDLPDTVDWRKQGYVTEVKNQGQCGSCWAFSVTGSLEGQNFKKTGKLVSLSEKNLMDCSKREGNQGCDGGLMDNGFEYVIKNKGIDTEESYPYKPEDGKCKFNQANIGATAQGCKDIWKGSENELQKAVATEGPISVGIDASHPSFQLYKSGVYYDELCSTRHLDHGVLVVGYGNEQGQDYWLVKNSWGPKWGQEGYILMTRNKRNNCGIASQASFPTM